MAQWVQDLAPSLQQLRPLLWYGVNPWPKKFHMPLVQPKKKREKPHVKTDTQGVMTEVELGSDAAASQRVPRNASTGS